jgi:predicted DNA-binding transcriptional regulator YafY
VDKLERLLNLTLLLLETPRPITAEEIHAKLEGYPERSDSFHRAFERDKDDLRELGVPIEVVAVPGADPPVVGYRIPPEHYYLPDIDLEPDEVEALQLALAAIRLGELSIPGTEKLGGTVVPQAPPTSDAFAEVPATRSLVVLYDAILNRSVVTFSYRGEVREVEPHRLNFSKGRWYLTGHDRSRNGERHFRVDRIDGQVTAGAPGSFERPQQVPEARFEGWDFGEGEPVIAELAVDAALVPHLRTVLPPTTPWEERPDGSAIARVEVTNGDAFRGFALGFLDHVEILGPPELRAEMVTWLRGVAGP